MEFRLLAFTLVVSLARGWGDVAGAAGAAGIEPGAGTPKLEGQPCQGW